MLCSEWLCYAQPSRAVCPSRQGRRTVSKQRKPFSPSDILGNHRAPMGNHRSGPGD
ncbi:unnamed protein product [Staurois parvus]|uniref:Uncharacterized protein n=1 Tax=Staurois parvus TaxID=386267 RepID=A0ABN9D465_9NEOB|nr:unnamed protein product [Staurois parvus]